MKNFKQTLSCKKENSNELLEKFNKAKEVFDLVSLPRRINIKRDEPYFAFVSGVDMADKDVMLLTMCFLVENKSSVQTKEKDFRLLLSNDAWMVDKLLEPLHMEYEDIQELGGRMLVASVTKNEKGYDQLELIRFAEEDEVAEILAKTGERKPKQQSGFSTSHYNDDDDDYEDCEDEEEEEDDDDDYEDDEDDEYEFDEDDD